MRAIPSEKGNGNTITLLSKDNYSARPCKVEGAPIVNDLWDVVSGERKAPIVLAGVRNADVTATVNHADIAAKTAELKEYHKDAKHITNFLLCMISDSQLFHVKPIRIDPVAMWQRLIDTFERTWLRDDRWSCANANAKLCSHRDRNRWPKNPESRRHRRSLWRAKSDTIEAVAAENVAVETKYLVHLPH